MDYQKPQSAKASFKNNHSLANSENGFDLENHEVYEEFDRRSE